MAALRMLFTEARKALKPGLAALTGYRAESRLESEAYVYGHLSSTTSTSSGPQRWWAH